MSTTLQPPREAIAPATRWTDAGTDPMDPAIIHARQRMLTAARRTPVPDRIAYLRDLVRGRRLLDIGIVDHDLGSDRREHWLHGRLAEVAASSLGIDVLEAPLHELAAEGYDVACMDVTEGDLPDGRFDVIVAGELVEHLDRPGHLFRAAAELLDEHGVLVLTTPNPFAPWRVVQNLLDRPYENADHALLLNGWGIAELAERAGLRLWSFRGISAPPAGWKAQWLDRAVRAGMLPLVPETTCESVMYEVVRADAAG